MGYRSDAYCNISITRGDPDNHADNVARLKAIITDTLDGDDFHYPPEGLCVVEGYGTGVIDVYFEYTDSTIYELAQALLATLRNLVDDGWAIVDVDAKRIGTDGWIENPDIETWAILDGHILASNYDGAIGSIRRHGDTWVDTADTTVVTETKLNNMVAETIATHDIRASYTVNDTGEWHEVDTNGYDFAEIVDDMLNFWNEASNRAEEFAIARTFHQDDYTVVTEIVGTVYSYRDGNIATDIVDTVTVQVTAVER